MSMCFVLSLLVLLFDSQIAPTFSTCTVMGNSTSTFIVCSSWTINFNSFTTSDKVMYSASVVDSTTFSSLCFSRQLGFTKSRYGIKIYLSLFPCHWQNHCHSVLSVPTCLCSSSVQIIGNNHLWIAQILSVCTFPSNLLELVHS